MSPENKNNTFCIFFSQKSVNHTPAIFYCVDTTRVLFHCDDERVMRFFFVFSNCSGLFFCLKESQNLVSLDLQLFTTLIMMQMTVAFNLHNIFLNEYSHERENCQVNKHKVAVSLSFTPVTVSFSANCVEKWERWKFVHIPLSNGEDVIFWKIKQKTLIQPAQHLSSSTLWASERNWEFMWLEQLVLLHDKLDSVEVWEG